MSAGEKPGSAVRRDGSVIWGGGGLAGAEKPFDAMNNVVANLLLNITRCSNTTTAQQPLRSVLTACSRKDFLEPVRLLEALSWSVINHIGRGSLWKLHHSEETYELAGTKVSTLASLPGSGLMSTGSTGSAIK